MRAVAACLFFSVSLQERLRDIPRDVAPSWAVSQETIIQFSNIKFFLISTNETTSLRKRPRGGRVSWNVSLRLLGEHREGTFQQDARCAGEGWQSIRNTNIWSARIQHRLDTCHRTEVMESTQIEKSTCNPPSTGQYWEYSSLNIKGVGRWDKDANSIRLCIRSVAVFIFFGHGDRKFELLCGDFQKNKGFNQ